MRKGPARLLILSAAFVLLFFGAGSSANAWQGGGRFFGHGARFGFRAGGFHHRAFFGPHRAFFGSRFVGGHRFFFDRFHRPFRFVRVRVFDPFPHFVWRRVFFAPPAFVGPSCSPW